MFDMPAIGPLMILNDAAGLLADLEKLSDNIFTSVAVWLKLRSSVGWAQLDSCFE